MRPTPDRVRETLFNWLGQSLDGLACLDLFAGSGALGFEAASRGAARVVLVEQDRAVFDLLKKTRDEIGARQVEVVLDDAFAYLKRMPDVRRGFPRSAVQAECPAGGIPGVEGRPEEAGRPHNARLRGADAAFAPGEPWHELKRARAGQVSYQLFEWRSS